MIWMTCTFLVSKQWIFCSFNCQMQSMNCVFLTTDSILIIYNSLWGMVYNSVFYVRISSFLFSFFLLLLLYIHRFLFFTFLDVCIFKKMILKVRGGRLSADVSSLIVSKSPTTKYLYLDETGVPPCSSGSSAYCFFHKTIS